MIYRVTFTHGPDFEFVLASMRSMARLRAWNDIAVTFLFVDPTRPFDHRQISELNMLKCVVFPTPTMCSNFTGPTFNWSWEGIYVQILAYKWMLMHIGLNKTDYIMRADSDTVFTSSRFLNYTSYGGDYIGKGNDRTFEPASGPFRPTEGPCTLISAETFVGIASLLGPQLKKIRAEWPDLPLVDDVFYSYLASKSKPINPIKYYEHDWYTGTTVEEFQTYLSNGQQPGGGFLFHWLGHLKNPVKNLLAGVNWVQET